MKKLFLLAGIFALMSTLSLRAQVTIGAKVAPDPSAVLDLQSNGDLGLLLPRVVLTDTAVAAPFANHVKGMFVYNTTPSADGKVVEGVYYNDGSRWWPVGGGGATVTGGASSWMISGTTTPSASNTDSIYQMGSVAIGTAAAPDPTAILNVESADQGVLFPRVTLTSSTDSATIAHPTRGLLVYNTGADANFPTIGYMYWDGTAWKLFAAGTADAADATLICSGAALSPAIQVTGGVPIPAGTLLQVPYNVSNGGMYNGATLVSTNNPDVTATISSNVLMEGNGVLSFLLSGTPTSDQEAPVGIHFDLSPFLDANPGITGCDSVIVGNIMNASINSVAVMGYLKLANDEDGNQNYFLACNSPDGKYSVRVRVPAGLPTIARGNQSINMQIRNNQSAPQTVIWNYLTVSTLALVDNANMLTIPSQYWGGDNDTGTTWTNSGTTTTNYGNGYWGNVGIYDGNGPEYRRYTWIPLGEDSKVAYEVTALAALDTATPTAQTATTLLKVYIKFEQVTAM